MSKGLILVVDDEASARGALNEILSDEGFEVCTAPDGFKALQVASDRTPDVVVTDLKMPGMDGLTLLQKLKERGLDCPVVLMTAFGAVETAVHAMRAGAYDYVTKPLNSDELIVVLERCLEQVALRREATELRARLVERRGFGSIVGSSSAMRELLEKVEQVAPTKATVLITGESGTGKELVAEVLHERSDRARGPFVKLHCAALTESLLESELFGHEKGAFTGADRRREGRFERAHGGTLFLDEIGDISATTQVKLLRVLQEQQFERVGGATPVRVDVRVIAATNRDLRRMVREGTFREDLYYRLNVINLHLPPLRERQGDVGMLLLHFLERFAKLNRRPIERFSDEALRSLLKHPWPGNVRELANVVERAVVLCQGTVIERSHLPAEVLESEDTGVPGCPRVPGATLAELERYAILETLAHVGGSTVRAAQMLGISVRKVQYRLREYAEAPPSPVPAIRASAGSRN